MGLPCPSLLSRVSPLEYLSFRTETARLRDTSMAGESTECSAYTAYLTSWRTVSFSLSGNSVQSCLLLDHGKKKKN